MKVAVPVENGRVSPAFARAPTFEIFEVDDGGVRPVSTAANPYADRVGGVGQAVVEWLASTGVEAVVAANVGSGAFENLQLAGIRFYQAPPGMPAEEAVKAALSGTPGVGGAAPYGRAYGPGRGRGRMRRSFWRWCWAFAGRGMAHRKARVMWRARW